MIKRTAALVAAAALASSAWTPVFAQKESSFPPAATFNGSEKVMILQNGPAPLNRLVPLSTLGGLTEVANNAALQALTASAGTVVYRASFATPGDGGDGQYRFTASNCANPDNGGEVQSTVLIGCWSLLPRADGVSFYVWGAVPEANVDDPLKASIAWACRTHIPILIPYNTAPYLIRSEIDIGDGTDTTFSSCDGVTVRVVQQYPEGTAAVNKFQVFAYNGPSGVIPFVLRGPAESLNLSGIAIDCKSICATGIEIINVLNSDFGWLATWNNIGPAFIVTSRPSSIFVAGMEGSLLHDMWADLPSVGGSGMQIGDATCVTCVVATIDNIFRNITMNYDSNTAGTFGISLGYANDNTFINVRATKGNGEGHSPGVLGNPLIITPPPGDTTFPSDNVFYHPIFEGAVLDPGPTWTATRGVHFDQFNTVFHSYPVSSTYGLFWGVTDTGVPFPGPTAWTPTDASGAALSLTVSDAQYQKQGNRCTIQFNITWPITADGSVSEIGGNPCIPLNGLSSVAGGSPSYSDFGSGLYVLCGPSIAVCNFYKLDGVATLNSDMSTHNVRASLTYLTNP